MQPFRRRQNQKVLRKYSSYETQYKNCNKCPSLKSNYEYTQSQNSCVLFITLLCRECHHADNITELRKRYQSTYQYTKIF